MMKENRGFKGVWIPREIYLSKELNWTDKILYIEIHSLSKRRKDVLLQINT